MLAVARAAECAEISLAEVFKPASTQNALIILNQKIELPVFLDLWQQYSLRVCADGGANRLFDYFTTESDRLAHIPDFIIGDLDSLRDDVRQWYAARGCVVIRQSTQYATDLHKCLDLVQVYYAAQQKGLTIRYSELDDVDGLLKLCESLNELPSQTASIQLLLVGAVDGRFDHTVQSIALLFKLRQSKPFLSVFFISATDLLFLVPQSEHSPVYVGYDAMESVVHGSNCGLLPVGGEIVLTTKGLKWDVLDWPSSIRGDVSSSNRLVGASGVLIKASDDFIFNIELDHQKLRNWYS